MDKKEKIVDFISEAAVQALLYEVSVTPKPGLVDRSNNGAHKDMDFFTFMSSAAALGKYFYQMAEAGYSWQGELKNLFLELREIGKKAECAMFKATGNINTHKGLVFSIGILSGVSTYYYKKEGSIKSEAILMLCKEMTHTILEEEFDEIKERSMTTKGEYLYKKYGVKGIRGEVAEGFPSIRKIGLPLLRDLKQKSNDRNKNLVQVLLHLLNEVEDTNILGRHDFDKLTYVQEESKKALILGGIFTNEGLDYIDKMDKDFIKQNISPGGCADLLAVTIMMDAIENSDI